MLSINSLYRSFKNKEDNFSNLYESVLNDFNIENITSLFEISINASSHFKQLEIDLSPFTNKPYKEFKKGEINQIAKQLSKTLKSILKIDTQLYIDNFENCMVYPEYYFISTNPKLDKDKKPIIEESLLRIKKAHFFIDINLFMYKLKLTPAELVGVLLHEIGHITYHQNFVTRFFSNFLSRTRSIAILGTFITTIKLIFMAMTPQLIGIVLAIMFLFTRTLSFFEHKEEYYCDKFAIKYGYGDEIANAIIKLGKYTGDVNTKSSRGLFMKIIDFVKTVFNLATHPAEINRICKIADRLKDEYIESYPKIKNTLERDLNKLGC